MTSARVRKLMDQTINLNLNYLHFININYLNYVIFHLYSPSLNLHNI